MITNTSFVSPLGTTIARYLALKQSLGRKYTREQGILNRLDSFLHDAQSDLTAETFVQCAQTQQHLAPGVRRKWMCVVRNLCLYRRRTDPACFVPDPLQFPIPHQPVRPHIFTEVEIIRLLDAIKKLGLSTQSPLRQENVRLALVLLYTSGLRCSELCRLIVGDYSSTEHTLLIRESKFHKSRLIVLSPDGGSEIENHLKIRRNRRLPVSADLPLIWNRYTEKGDYERVTISRNFRLLFNRIGIRTASGQLPRLHDFRHTFAVHALFRWYREGANVQAKLPMLSTYMGHVSIVSTQYYLRFIDEVVGSASGRFEKYCSALVTSSDQRGAA